MMLKYPAFKSLLFIPFLLLFGFFFTDAIHAQVGLNSMDLSRVEANDVTDAQLRTFVERAQAEGIGMDEAFMMARQRGLRQSVANQLRARVQQLSPRQQPDPVTGIERREPADEIPQDFFRPQRVETEEMRRTFGSHIFRRQQTEMSPTQNIPTPVTYTLGAGDELAVYIWGDQTDTYRLVVNAEGSVMIDNLGPVFVQGLTVTEANNIIIEQLSQIYSGLRASRGERTTFARVTLDRLRTIQVSVIGEAVNPGDYAIPSNSTVFNALYRAGGPDENGSYRRIRVIRGNEPAAELDLYRFLVDGDPTGNRQLRDGDIIQILPYENRVEVFGETKRSDLYFEVKTGETLDDLVRFAGYFTDRAYTRQFRVHRNTPTERQIVTVRSEDTGQFEMRSGDVLHVDQILNRFENRVSITGAVWRSGDFELQEGMSLLDLIEEADGIRPDAFMSRALLNRMLEDLTFRQISFDLQGLLQDPHRHNIPLMANDHVVIRSVHNMDGDRNVRIEGAVHNEGSYIFREGMTVEDLIVSANGFTDAASEGRIEISRRIIGEAIPDRRGNRLAEVFTFRVNRDLSVSNGGERFELHPYDVVFIHRRPDYREQMTVTITGEVMYPGTYVIQDRNERISALVQRAGGLTREAFPEGARVLRETRAIDRPDIVIQRSAVTGLQELDVMDEIPFFGQVEIEEVGRRVAGERETEETLLERRADLNRQNRYEQTEEELTSDLRRIGLNMPQILRSPGSADDLYLRDGDVVHIPSEPQTVAVRGAVLQDVEIRYRDGMSLARYIGMAGGYSENARSKRAYVVYANGDVEFRRRYLFGLISSNPEIRPGAQIIVPEKAIRDRMSTGEVVSISAAIVGMSTSLIIAIDRLSR
jgi:protein involved in polysaccharide export with SLBB domain